jgi:hypothetical protein
MNNRSLIFSITLVVCTIGLSFYAFSSDNGFTNRTLKSSTSGCGSCHGSSANSGVVVTITGPDNVTRNQTATYTLTISGGPGISSGCDISAKFGSVNAISTSLKLSGSEVTQRSGISMTSGSVSLQFSFTASGTGGSDTLYATGISTNGSGSSGDQWNWAPKKVITVLTPTDVREEPIVAHSYALNQNYPNPFNPTTDIGFQIPQAAFVSLKVFDVRGNEVARLINKEMHAGSYTETWNAGNLASGVYYYRLTAGSFSQIRKLLLLK